MMAKVWKIDHGPVRQSSAARSQLLRWLLQSFRFFFCGFCSPFLRENHPKNDIWIMMMMVVMIGKYQRREKGAVVGGLKRTYFSESATTHSSAHFTFTETSSLFQELNQPIQRATPFELSLVTKEKKNTCWANPSTIHPYIPCKTLPYLSQKNHTRGRNCGVTPNSQHSKVFSLFSKEFTPEERREIRVKGPQRCRFKRFLPSSSLTNRPPPAASCGKNLLGQNESNKSSTFAGWCFCWERMILILKQNISYSLCWSYIMLVF